MTKTHAQLIMMLLTNAGYLDDADELIADQFENDENAPDSVFEFCTNMDSLIAEVNAALPEDERTDLNMVKEYNDYLG